MLICINILSNDKQVIHYNYFIHCLKHTSHFNLFSEHMLLVGNVQERQWNHMRFLLFLFWRITD